MKSKLTAPHSIQYCGIQLDIWLALKLHRTKGSLDPTAQQQNMTIDHGKPLKKNSIKVLPIKLLIVM